MKIFIPILFLFTFTITIAQDSWIIDKNGCKIHNPNPLILESVEWTGDCVDSVGNGFGELIWYRFGFKTKSVYEGFMVNGKPNGKGKYILSSGTILEGEFIEGDLDKGTRTMKIGKYIYVYTGYFIDDQLSGEGELRISNSTIYKGEFKDGVREGYGIETYENDEYFEGIFENDYYKNGKFVSKREDYSIQSDNWKFFTALSGTLTFSDSTIYIGELDHAIPHGLGRMNFKNGDVFEGNFKHGKPHKKGKYIFSNGIIYIAEWKKGSIEGKGEIIYPSGLKTVGIWKNNILVQEINGH